MPPIAPPDMPFFSVDSPEVLLALEVVVVETLNSEDADREAGRDVVGVAVAWELRERDGIGRGGGLGRAERGECFIQFCVGEVCDGVVDHAPTHVDLVFCRRAFLAVAVRYVHIGLFFESKDYR